jgi:hypothetical protein
MIIHHPEDETEEDNYQKYPQPPMSPLLSSIANYRLEIRSTLKASYRRYHP